MVDNQVVIVSNYMTDALQDTLDKYAENGYRLVNSILAKNKYSIDVMYLFFTKVENGIAQEKELGAADSQSPSELLDKILSDIKKMDYRMIDCDVMVSQDEVLEIIQQYKED